jgi:hypothetical protein
MLGDLCWEAGIEPKPKIQSLLYSGFTLEEWCATGKFGPSYVELRATFEHSHQDFRVWRGRVKVIDPNKLEVVEAVGCRVHEVCI